MLIHQIKHEFTTSISPERVLTQIKNRLPSGFLSNDSEFYGCVSENSFKISKNLRYNMPVFVIVRNSFSPVAVGKVEKNERGTTVKLKLRMGVLVFPFIFLIEMLSLLSALVGIIGCLLGDFVDGIPLTLSGLFMFFVIELLLYFSFKRPAKRMIERLEEILLY